MVTALLSFLDPKVVVGEHAFNRRERKRVYPFIERARAPYAVNPAETRGRVHPEDISSTRNEFMRDRDRIIHATAFRRLKHKTQVFVEHEGDHFRTRLTHTIEVAQIARSIARALGMDEDLAEGLALAHDLGHTPFGHTGEDALDACMKDFGGFDHNAQALRIVTRLERRYATHDGLNLTWEMLEGLVKHNGPLLDANRQPVDRYQAKGVPAAILEYDAFHSLWLDTYASAEAQVAAISDDIAYNAHDIDDGLRAGLFDLSDLEVVPFVAGLLEEINARWPGLERTRVIHELGRRVITRFVEDVITETMRRLDRIKPKSADEVRRASEAVVGFSPLMKKADADIKAFLFPHMYRHPSVLETREKASQIVRDLFENLLADPTLLPAEWQVDDQPTGQPPNRMRVARRVADYIAGMTDRYAVQEHQRLFDVTPDLR